MSSYVERKQTLTKVLKHCESKSWNNVYKKIKKSLNKSTIINSISITRHIWNNLLKNWICTICCEVTINIKMQFTQYYAHFQCVMYDLGWMHWLISSLKHQSTILQIHCDKFPINISINYIPYFNHSICTINVSA